MDKYEYDEKTHTLEISGESITALDIERIRGLNPNAVYKIYIHDTLITDLPNLFNYVNVLSMFENVDTLQLPNNKLTTIPTIFVGALPRLKRIDLENNKITHIPTELFDGIYIENLQNVEILNLSNNELTEVPDAFSKLPYLVYIDFSNNKLSALPTSLDYYSRLNRRIGINLNNNKFHDIPLFLLKPQENINDTLKHIVYSITHSFKWKKNLTTILSKIAYFGERYGFLLERLYNSITFGPDTISINKFQIATTLLIHYYFYSGLQPMLVQPINTISDVYLMPVPGREILDRALEMVYNNQHIRNLPENIMNMNSFNPNGVYTILDITTSPVNLFMDGNPLPEIMYSIDQPYTSEDYELLIKYTIQTQGAARDKNEITKQLMSTIFRGHFNPVVGDNIHARHASPSKAYTRPMQTKRGFSGINPDAVNDVYSYLKEPVPIISEDTRKEYKRLRSEGKLGGGRRRRTRRHRRSRRRPYTRHRRYNKR